MNTVKDIIYIFPKRRFFVISRPVIRTVLYNVGMSSVDVKVSAKPNGSISGTQPAEKWVQSFTVSSERAREDGARTPNIFHGPTSLMHLVLLGDTTAHEVHVTRSVPFHLQRARLERPLLADEDMEVVISRVKARVALGTEWRAKDDEVLSDARVDDVHRAHRAACIVEHPFGAVRVERYARVGVGGGEVGEDV